MSIARGICRYAGDSDWCSNRESGLLSSVYNTDTPALDARLGDGYFAARAPNDWRWLARQSPTVWRVGGCWCIGDGLSHGQNCLAEPLGGGLIHWRGRSGGDYCQSPGWGCVGRESCACPNAYCGEMTVLIPLLSVRTRLLEIARWRQHGQWG